MSASRSLKVQNEITVAQKEDYPLNKSYDPSDNSDESVEGILDVPWNQTQPYDPTTSLQDIHYCFRLLLGRFPSASEWAGHSTLVGTNLRSVVRSYLGSKEFLEHRLLGPSNEKDIRLTHAEKFVIYTEADDLAVGKHVEAGGYEKGLTTIIREMIRPSMHVIDLGANIGFFTMLAASIVGPRGSVLAVEPNPLNVRLIEASRRANGFGNIVIAACGVGKELGILSFASVFSNGMTAPVGDMLSEIMATQIVPCMPLHALIPKDQKIDFIKIDVEGAEYLALSAARELLARWRPVIASEFSPKLLQANSGISGSDYLEFYIGLGYQIGIIDDDGSAPNATIPEVLQFYELSERDHIDILLSRSVTPRISKWQRILRGRVGMP